MISSSLTNGSKILQHYYQVMPEKGPERTTPLLTACVIHLLSIFDGNSILTQYMKAFTFVVVNLRHRDTTYHSCVKMCFL